MRSSATSSPPMRTAHNSCSATGRHPNADTLRGSYEYRPSGNPPRRDTAQRRQPSLPSHQRNAAPRFRWRAPPREATGSSAEARWRAPAGSGRYRRRPRHRVPCTQRYPGCKWPEVGYCPGRAVADASATGRTKAATRRGSGGISAAVGCLRSGRSPGNPSATGRGMSKADRHLP